MATLVLTTVGGIVGGPIGAALGGLAGNAVDRAALGPRGREGPRLAELRVQTSSYGSAIPLLFGTMRVAGTVIWAADLIENRERSGGKGRAATTTYSYQASFAVLLSGRPIRAVRRVWADGNLLRGAAGDLKVKAQMRVHRGGEEQAADPLIASAEGAGLTPAHRGCAYVVFEDLPLAEYGNRIPSLSFEVEADAGAVGAAAIASAVAPVSGGGAPALDGFAATGGTRGVLELLARAGGGWWAQEGAGLRWGGAGDPVVEIADEGVRAAGLDGPSRGRSAEAADAAPGAVAVSHYDPARDHQVGLQRAGAAGQAGLQRARGGAGREERVEMPAAMSAGAAKTLAGALLAEGRGARVRRTVTLGLGGLAVRPGQVVRVKGEAGRWRVLRSAVEGMATRLTLAPVAFASPAAAASAGRVAGAPDVQAGETRMVLAETPALDDSLLSRPRLTVVAAGTGAGWRSASLLWSLDEGTSWTEAGATAAPGVIGAVESAPPPAPATLRDETGVMVVRLLREDMDLHDADGPALDRGANLCVAGGELVQFGRAEPLGAGRWRLSRLLRGRRGTEGAGVAAGDGFALLEPASAAVIDLPAGAAGRTVRVMASGVGDGEPVEAALFVTGASIRPPSPVGLRMEATADGGGLLRWTRRSRLGWRWTDGVDAPLGEETEAYRVTLMRGGVAEERSTGAPELALSAGERAGVTAVAVRQRGTWAESLSATLEMGG